MSAKFGRWLDTFIQEKGLDLEHVFTVEAGEGFFTAGVDFGANHIPLGCVLDAVKRAPENEQRQIKAMLVKLDFKNAPILPFFAHLARALAI